MKKQLFLGKNKPTKKLMMPLIRHMHNKAKGGLWTSTYENGTSEWVQTGIPASNEGWLLTVNKNARILKIDNYDDLDAVYQKYGMNNPPYPVYPMQFIDFEKIATDYDGMWLTSTGQYKTRFSTPQNLYSWDCESTHWFRWVFDDVESIGWIK